MLWESDFQNIPHHHTACARASHTLFKLTTSAFNIWITIRFLQNIHVPYIYENRNGERMVQRISESRESIKSDPFEFRNLNIQRSPIRFSFLLLPERIIYVCLGEWRHSHHFQYIEIGMKNVRRAEFEYMVYARRIHVLINRTNHSTIHIQFTHSLLPRPMLVYLCS